MDAKQFAEICQRRHAAGESFQTIANNYPPATKPAIRRVCLNGAVPRRLAQAIGLEPEAKLKSTRRRIATLDEIARSLGYASWCNYGTNLLREWKEVNQ